MTEKDLRRLAVAAEVHEVHVHEVGPVAVGALLTVGVVLVDHEIFYAYLDGLTTEGLTKAWKG